MLHILFITLKIIGIILASILLCLLALVLAILFVPVRYRITAKKEEQPLEGAGKVTWLLHVLSIHLSYQNSDFNYVIKVFGIPLEKIKTFTKKILSIFKRKKRTSARKQSEFIQTNNTKNEDSDKNTCLNENLSNDTNKKDEFVLINDTNSVLHKKQNCINTAEVSNTETRIKQSVAEDRLSENNEKRIKSSVLENFIKKIEIIIHSAREKIKSILSKIYQTVQKVKKTMSSIYEKAQYWITFLCQEDTQNTIRLIKIEAISLIKHILPKKIKGDVLFGFDDPSKTGQTLGVIYMFYPMYEEKITISSDFTQKIFRCDLEVKGRIYIFIIVKSILKIYFDKDFQSVKSKWKKN